MCKSGNLMNFENRCFQILFGIQIGFSIIIITSEVIMMTIFKSTTASKQSEVQCPLMIGSAISSVMMASSALLCGKKQQSKLLCTIVVLLTLATFVTSVASMAMSTKTFVEALKPESGTFKNETVDREMVLTEEDPNIFEIAANATNLPLEDDLEELSSFNQRRIICLGTQILALFIQVAINVIVFLHLFNLLKWSDGTTCTSCLKCLKKGADDPLPPLRKMDFSAHDYNRGLSNSVLYTNRPERQQATSFISIPLTPGMYSITPSGTLQRIRNTAET